MMDTHWKHPKTKLSPFARKTHATWLTAHCAAQLVTPVSNVSTSTTFGTGPKRPVLLIPVLSQIVPNAKPIQRNANNAMPIQLPTFPLEDASSHPLRDVLQLECLTMELNVGIVIMDSKSTTKLGSLVKESVKIPAVLIVPIAPLFARSVLMVMDLRVFQTQKTSVWRSPLIYQTV